MTQPDNMRWFINHEGKVLGPYTAEQMVVLVRRLRIGPDDVVHREGGNSWIAAKADPVVRSMLPQTAGDKIWSRVHSRYGYAAVILIGVIFGWMVWPFYSAYQLLVGLREGDITVLENRVDWDRVRRGVRDDMNALFISRMNADGSPGDSLGAGLAAVMAPVFVDRMIESYVQPRAVAQLVKAEKERGGSQSRDNGVPQSIARTGDVSLSQVRFAFFHGGPFTFRVDVSAKAQYSGNVAKLMFEWNGGWRLTRVHLPEALYRTRENQNRAEASAPVERQNTASKTQVATRIEPLQIRLRNKGFQKSNLFQEEITFELEVMNRSGQDIRAFDGVLRFNDLLGNRILASKLAINDSVAKGSTITWRGSLDYNQFKDSHKKFRSAEKENLSLEFVVSKVLFSDGTTKEF